MRASAGPILLALLTLELAGQGGREAPAYDSPGEDPAAPAETRIEHFALELPTAAGTEVLGMLRWLARRDGDGVQLEWELDFPGEGLRLFTVERLGPQGDRLIWRELQAGAGRSLAVEWASTDGDLVLREWARDGTSRETRSVASGMVLPLSLLELARAGSLTQGRFRVLDPTGRGLVVLDLATSYHLPAAADPGSAEPERQVELRRTDGTLAGRYRFRRGELLGFEWQESGLAGRRIDADAHAALHTVRPRPIVFEPIPARPASPGHGG